jgi:hypothetical protein
MIALFIKLVFNKLNFLFTHQYESPGTKLAETRANLTIVHFSNSWHRLINQDPLLVKVLLFYMAVKVMTPSTAPLMYVSIIK